MAAPTLYPANAQQFVQADGTAVHLTLSQNNCIPTPGSGRFTLAGTNATPGTWSIVTVAVLDGDLVIRNYSDVVLTLFGRILSTETPTITYTRANDAGDITNAGAEALATFVAAALENRSNIASSGVAASRLPSGPFHPWLN